VRVYIYIYSYNKTKEIHYHYHHHHLPPWIRTFDLFRHRPIAIVSWNVHDLFFLEVCSWGRVSAVWCCPFFPNCRNTPSNANLEEEEIVDDPGNDGNASMSEQVKRPNPWRKMIVYLLICQIYFWNKTLHVSDSSSDHYRQFFNVHTAMV